MSRRVLVQNGLVYDGTGAGPRQADILIENGTIADISPCLAGVEDAKTIDAAGYAVTPGFVDIHRHCDLAPLRDADFGQLELAQGITTTVVGNCGLAPVPINPAIRQESCDFIEPVVGPVAPQHAFKSYKAYFKALAGATLPINMGVLAGAGAIKTCVKGFVDTPYTHSELYEAQALVQNAMAEGALGVSLGIMYQPECYSTAAELSSVIAPAARANGVLTTHIRGEGDSLVESVGEVIDIAWRAGIRLHISHFKATGIHNWNEKIFRAIELIEGARARGMQVTADFYPYTGGATTLLSLVPPSVLSGGGEATLKSLATPEGKALLRQEIYKTHPGWDNMALSIGWQRIVIASTTLPQHAGFGGRDVAALAAENGYRDASDFVCDLLVAEKGRVGIVVLSMSQQDVDTVARLPWTAVVSDALYGGGSNPHPRLYGSFARVIREYALERRVLTLPEAIHKMTGLPAGILGIENRGLLQKGCAADIAIFDPEQFKDRATFADSRHKAVGMHRVLLAGETVYQNGLALQKQGQLIRKAT